MDEREFRRILDLFPVVRSRDYCAASDLSAGSTSCSTQDEVMEWKNTWNRMDEKDNSNETESDDAFWQKLRRAAEGKVGPKRAEKFCEAFRMAHEKLVNKELSAEAARRFINNGH
ncbi:uncharacterized protein LOC121992365 [Zingiber officinale]|uniref:uncharacterized protein LOC121992365 n=1 Tax=Zingiber officinale TaxID=94328 RepID=UPI001C4B598E|nr:uncharacterized protein LOC121992365 [Zingiber officinale]